MEEQNLENEPNSPRVSLDSIDSQPKTTLGTGTFGWVYKIMLDGAAVAIKELKDTGNPEQTEMFVREAVLMSKLNHHGIIRLQGFSFTSKKTLMVLEYAPHGSLMNYMKNHPKLAWSVKIHIISQVSGAALFINQQGYFYGDPKSENVLVLGDEKKPIIKLGDLGSATPHGKVNSHFTFEYSPPELAMATDNYNAAAEVFGFACVYGEVCTGNQVLSSFNVTNRMQKFMLVTDNEHDPFPEDTPPKLAELIKLCWDNDPQKRPDLEKVNTQIHKIDEEISSKLEQ